MIKPLHVVPSINSLPFFAKICDNLLHSLNLDPNAIVVVGEGEFDGGRG